MPFCRMVCLWPQNMALFPISLFHWSQISFPWAFFWGLQTARSHREPDLENRVGVKPIQIVIHVVLPLLWSICDMVHCLGERALPFSSFLAIFWWFLPSNVPIMLYNICYWWFFLCQCNQWIKYLAHPKIQMPVDVWIFGCFRQLSPIAVNSADWQFDYGMKWWIHVSSIVYAKTPFCCVKTAANNVLNCWWVVVFGWLWSNAVPTLNTVFSLTNVHAKWWIHCLLVSSTPLLSQATSIYDRPKWVCGFFLCFPGQLPNLGDLNVQHYLCLYDHV